MRLSFRLATLPLLAAPLLAGCNQPAAPDAPADRLKVENAWIRLPAVTGRPGAGYFTVRNGPDATAIVGAATPAAARSELHESMDHGGMMSMKPVDQVPVAPSGTVAFAPGGKHVMLFGLSPDLKPGGETTLLVSFANDQRLQVKARLVGAGDPAPQ